MPLKINIIAILFAVLVCFVIQMIWYTAIFAKPWMKRKWVTTQIFDLTKNQYLMKGMLLTFIGIFLFAWVLAFYLAGWKYIPGTTDMAPFITGINSAISVWGRLFCPSSPESDCLGKTILEIVFYK